MERDYRPCDACRGTGLVEMPDGKRYCPICDGQGDRPVEA